MIVMTMLYAQRAPLTALAGRRLISGSSSVSDYNTKTKKKDQIKNHKKRQNADDHLMLYSSSSSFITSDGETTGLRFCKAFTTFSAVCNQPIKASSEYKKNI